MKTPNAPHRDEPKRRTPLDMPTEIPLHRRRESYKMALAEDLLARGESADCTLLCLNRLEKRRFAFFGARRFYGYAALIRIPGNWLVEGRAMTPENAILAALEQPAPFSF